MWDRDKKENKAIEVSLGLIVGYLIAGLANMSLFDKTWSEAISDSKLVIAFAGIALSIGILWWKNKEKQKNNHP